MLGELEQIVLLAVMRTGDEAYGVPIHAEIRKRTGRDVSVASVYKVLERLRDKGLVEARLGDPTPERGGRRKQYYTVSNTGRRELREALTAIRRMAHGLKAGLEPS